MTTERTQGRTGRTGAAMRLSLLSVCVVLGAGPAVGLELEDCIGLTSDMHFGESGHQDYGSGMMSYVDLGSFPHTHPTQRLVVVSCFDAATLWVNIYGEGFDFREAATGLLDDLVDAEQAYTLTGLEEEFNALGMHTNFSNEPVSHEPCSCGVAYPRQSAFYEPFDFENPPGLVVVESN